jgi:PAS domain S-box-containing protein
MTAKSPQVRRTAPDTAGIPPALLTESDFQMIAEAIPHIVWLATPGGATTYFNRQGTDYTGLPAEANYAMEWVGLVHPDDAEGALKAWRDSAQSETPFAFEYRIRRFDGTFRWHAARALPMRDKCGEVTAWIGTATDIDQHKQLELSLRMSEQEAIATLIVLRQIQSAAPWGFCFVDRDFRILRINESLARIGGTPADEQLGRTVAELVPSLWAQIEDAYTQALSGEPVVNLEVSGPSAQEPGRTLHWLTSYYPVRVDGEIIGVSNLIVDITQRIEDEEFRAAVMDNMAEGLFTLDGDGLLKYMNGAACKMLGWTEDELRGKSIHEAVHSQRIDGTRCPGQDCPLLKVRSEGLDVRVADETFTRKDGTTFPVAYSSAPLRVGSAVRGVVVVFRDVTDELGETAQALRELAKLSWVGRIRDALDEDRLVLYSQPIIPLAEGEPSEELLLRMIGPSGNVILPGSFLPVAEKYGLIGEIDRWVISEAIGLAAAGRRVEVNLSAASIDTLDMLGFIERKIREAHAEPSNIVFEITETALMRDIDTGAAFARGLAELGCGFALDDFGTGFGSFTYLKKLPVAYLKIDIEFVRDLTINPSNLHLVRAIVSLAQAFGVRTIAEGVEDEDTLTVLREEHVDFAQGFHFGRPAPIDTRQGPARMEFPGLSIDIITREVVVEGRAVELTSREFDLLAELATAPRRVFSREQLLLSVWHSSSDWQTPKTVNEHVRRIRHKIELDPARPRWIRTVSGAGYRFED